MSVNGDTERAQPYQVAIHDRSSGIALTPSSLVDSSGFYRPSKDVESKIWDMWRGRRPWVIGATSEVIANEILNKARVSIDGANLLLVCSKLRKVAELSAIWKPKTGIYCDDLVAIAENDKTQFLFLIEVKGTTLQHGLSHSNEAKMFYQPARTYYAIRRGMSSDSSLRLSGVITIVISHHDRRITLNVLNEAAALGFFADNWLPDGRWRDGD
jgi:hypothetical protein